jgi:hypothetical protein
VLASSEEKGKKSLVPPIVAADSRRSITERPARSRLLGTIRDCYPGDCYPGAEIDVDVTRSAIGLLLFQQSSNDLPGHVEYLKKFVRGRDVDYR